MSKTYIVSHSCSHCGAVIEKKEVTKEVFEMKVCNEFAAESNCLMVLSKEPLNYNWARKTCKCKSCMAFRQNAVNVYVNPAFGCDCLN